MRAKDSTMTDEVSAAYQALAKETPSAELDERILQAARGELERSPGATSGTKRGFHYQPYSIAASVCLCVLIASFYLNNKPPDALQSRLESIQTPRPATFDDSLEKASGREAAPEREASQLEALGQEALVNEAPANRARQDSNTNAPTAPAGVQADDENSLEEIVVTGSRVVRAELSANQAIIIDYRSSAELWLLEIQVLLETDESAAEAEIELFTEAYPDIDVNSALSELDE